MLRTLLLSMLFACTISCTYAQSNLEIQLGGSNFVGASINAVYNIPISKSGNQYLSLSFGIGVLAFEGPDVIIHAGLNYQVKSWGIGTEVSGFAQSPFWKSEDLGFIDMLVYPNLNYTFSGKKRWYLKLSTGAYFAFSKREMYDTKNSSFRFEGDVIPGAGLSVGYKI